MSSLDSTLGSNASPQRPPDQAPVADRAPGVLDAPHAASTIGMLALISLLAFEQLAVATVMPVVAGALDGTALYAAAFGAAVAAGMLGMVLAGRWCDRSGPLPPLLAGIAAFVLGLVIAGAAPDMATLVGGRLLQGGGGGMMSVALYVVVGRHYPPALHARIFAAFAAAWVLPAIVGPALAGLIARHLGWRWVFLAAALLAVPAALLLQRGLARLRPAADQPAPAGGRQRASLGLAAGAAASAALLYAGGEPMTARPLWLAIALVGLAVCAPRLLPAGTLRGRTGLPAVIALRGLVAATFFSAEVFIPLLLTSERGLSPVQAGLVLTGGALGWSAGSWLQGRDREAPSAAASIRRLRLGFMMLAGGTLSVALALWPAVPIAAAALGWAIGGMGIGMVFPTLSVLTLRFAPAHEQGAASSALQLADSLFSAVGLALASGLLAALRPASALLAYGAGFGFAAGLSVLGALLAGRARA
ncbi:MFS transporter [Aquabacterium sp.]|uniref:MFS transporter n=1 Tax=Aquabacterium sp. TaxID=1872578 RepID=UPI003783EA57